MATFTMTFIRISPGEMGATTQLSIYRKVEKTGQTNGLKKKDSKSFSISCLPHISRTNSNKSHSESGHRYSYVVRSLVLELVFKHLFS